MHGTPEAPRGEPYDPALDIALDEVLLDLARLSVGHRTSASSVEPRSRTPGTAWPTRQAARPAVRVWTPRGRAVVIGTASKAAEEVRLDECSAAGVPVRRRFSGGAAVLLSPEVVCFSAVFPYQERPGPRRGGQAPGLPAVAGADYDKAGTPQERPGPPGVDTIRGAYQVATSLVAKALADLGVEVVFEPPGDLAVVGRQERPGPSGNAVKRKIAGFAQARRRSAALVHGVLPISLDGAELDRLLGRPPEEPAYRRGRPHSEFVTDLTKELGSCEVAEVESALARALAGPDAVEEDFTPEEIETARVLVEEKYSKDEWNLRR